MKTRRIFLVLTIVLGLTVLIAGGSVQSSRGDCTFCRKITGTWNVHITTNSGFELNERLTFIPGGTDDEGSLISTNEVDNFVCSNSQGVWARTGERTFATTHLFFCFDSTAGPNGAPAGTEKIREVVTLSENGEELTGVLKFEAFDTNGTLVGGDDGTIKGTRMHVEPIQ